MPRPMTKARLILILLSICRFHKTVTGKIASTTSEKEEYAGWKVSVMPSTDAYVWVWGLALTRCEIAKTLLDLGIPAFSLHRRIP